ncbi:MAG: DUF2779 domain-containing protein [candidate division Zixibacteria bacterium]|nr:DUF2779 domain-containing protein [candidate division Zixibacteria bacterium]
MTDHKKNTYLTKTRLMIALQCPLRLWYQAYRHDLMLEIDPVSQHRIDTGIEVGKLATRLFPGGRLIGRDQSHEEAVKITTQLIDDKNMPAIFEAGFSFENVRIRTDILQRVEVDKWNLIEVKASNSVKKEYYYDAGIQYFTLLNSGVEIDDIYIMHLNRDYVYNGGVYDLKQLFMTTKITDEVKDIIEEIAQLVEGSQSVVGADTPPIIEPSKQCNGCEFFDICTEGFPKYWIYYLPRILKKKWRELTELGVNDIRNIPEHYELTPRQRLVRDCTTENKEYISKDMKSALLEPQYPMFFLDFETFNPALPLYPGSRPSQQIPFQWSCHLLGEDDDLKHFEFLHPDNTDPRPGFIKSLLDLLGTRGSIIHYAHFERTIIKSLAADFPQFEKVLLSLLDRCWDLKKVISENYYHPDFIGSYSIKRVLPVLVPSMTYDGMEISEGTMASYDFNRMISSDAQKDEKAQIFNALLEYCRQDTLAMVKLREVLLSKN